MPRPLNGPAGSHAGRAKAATGMIDWVRSIPAEALREHAFDLAERVESATFDAFMQSAQASFDLLLVLDQATRPSTILKGLLTAPFRHGLGAELAVVRALLRARQEVLSPRIDVEALHAALMHAMDAPMHYALGQAVSPVARRLLWRASSDQGLVADAVRFLASGSSFLRAGRIETRVKRKALGAAMMGAASLTSALSFAGEAMWLRSDRLQLVVYMAMSIAFAAAVAAVYGDDLKRELVVRDRVNALPPLRKVE